MTDTRWHQIETVTIPSSQTTTGEIPVGDFVAGSIRIPAAIDGAAITKLEVTNDIDDTKQWDDLRDTAGAAVTYTPTIAVNRMIPLPDEVFKFRFARIVFASQSAERTIEVFLRA